MMQADHTIFVGRRDHYQRAAKLVSAEPDRVVLTQRSSTLLLGPEAGWHEEADFFAAAHQSMEDGVEWLHVVSASGMRSHLDRQTSRFDKISLAQQQLSLTDGVVRLRCGSRLVAVKHLDRYSTAADFKIDRQARMLIADFGSRVEAVVVEDLGDRQVTLHLGGDAARDLLHLAANHWAQCPPLQSSEYEEAIGSTATSIPSNRFLRRA